MSRSGYSDDYDGWALICWRGAVASAIKGARGQAFLREMIAALDAMQDRRLIAGDIVKNGEVCAIGAVAVSRHVDVSEIDPEDRDTVAAKFGIAPALAAEIVWMNDEAGFYKETPEQRYDRMRRWVESQIRAQGIVTEGGDAQAAPGAGPKDAP